MARIGLVSLRDIAAAGLGTVMSILELSCPHCGKLLLRGLDQCVDVNGMLGKSCYSCGEPITLTHVAGWMKQRALDKARGSLAERTETTAHR